MEVTDIRVNLINSDSGVKAIGSFALDGMFAIRGVRVMEDKKGRNFVAFPAREKANGEYEDIAFPLNKEFYHTLTEAIVNEYKKQLDEKQLRRRKVLSSLAATAMTLPPEAPSAADLIRSDRESNHGKSEGLLLS